MKKLINLIALVMLVSTNVLTPLSYAQDALPEVIPENEVKTVEKGLGETEEIPEISEETPEVNSEEKGELEQENQDNETPEDILPNVQDDEETSVTDETEDVDTESDEVDQLEEETPENEIQDEEGKIEELEKDQEMTVMDVIPNTEVTLLPGTGFNSVIKTLANGGTEVPYTGVDNNIYSFERVDELPAGVTTGEISVAGSEYPVYAWFSGGTLYYTTKAEIIQLNENSQQMFYNCSELGELNLSNFKTSNVTNMNGILAGCSKLEEINLSGWDFSQYNIGSLMMNMTYGSPLSLKYLNMTNTKYGTTMNYTFGGLTNLEEILLDGADTSQVIDMGSIFNGDYNLTGLDLSNFDTSKVVNMGGIFGGCSKIEKINLSGWDFRNVNNTSLMMNMTAGGIPALTKLNMTNTKYTGNATYAFGGLNKLEELNLDGADTSNVTSMNAMFNGDSKLKELNLTDFNTNNVKDMSAMFYKCSSLTGLTLSNRDTSNVTNMYEMFWGCSELTWLDLSNWNTSNLINFTKIFGSCYGLEKLNLSGWNFTNFQFSNGPMWDMFATYPNWLKKLNLTNAKFSGDISYAFHEMNRLEEIKLDGIDTSKVTNMSSMFNKCHRLTGLDLSSFDTSNVTNMRYMFAHCDDLIGLDLSNFDTSNVTDMSSMFTSSNKIEWLNLSGRDFRKVGGESVSSKLSINTNPSLKKLNMTNAKFSGSMAYAFKDLKILEEIKLDGVDTSKVTNMSYMFGGCSGLKDLDLGSFDTSNVMDMSNMFASCDSLTGLDLGNFNTSNVTNMNGIFGYCNNLEEINLSGWDFRNTSHNMMNMTYGGNSSINRINITNSKYGTNMNQAFAGLRNLEEIEGLDTVDTSNVVNMNAMFYGCSSLTGLNLSNWNTSNVTGMEVMFSGCNKLESLKLDNWDLSKNPNMGGFISKTPSLKSISMSGWKIPENFQDKIGRNRGYPNNTIEEIDVTNWDLNKTKNLQGLFGDTKALKTIKGLDTWDTSGVTNMYTMFYGCSSLTGLDLSNWDTSNVTNMYTMFYGCSSLTGLDLSNWDTSNVNDMGSMFGGCSKLEEINLSGWDFRKYSNAGLMMNMTAGGIPALKKLNMANTKYTGNATYAFGGLNKLEELNLNGADTSNVTSMNAMFNGDSNLKILDLSSFDTSNVKDMNKMFYNTPNLKTIYASENFVTTALSGDNSSKDMFSGTTSVVGGNGTKFDSNYIDEEYAKIDKVGQTGYFTDKNAINVKFINTLDGTETTSISAKGQKLTPPSVDKYHVAGGYLDEAMTQEIDLNKGVDSYSEIYVKYDHNGSSGGGGGGGGSTKPDTPKDEQQPAEPSQSDASTGTNIKEPENNTGSNIQTGIQVNSSEQTPQNDNSNIQDSSTSSQNDEKIYSTEFQEAYEFAKGNGITTMPTIQKANMDGKLTRIAMAKMLSQYAINVLGQTPDTSKAAKFKDVTSKKDADYDNGVTLAYQLGIMGQNMPNNKFRPNDEVSRAEFVTALSRLLYQTTDGEYKSTSKYYTPHMAKLYNEGIINNTDPGMKERRGYVMIMLMRSAK